MTAHWEGRTCCYRSRQLMAFRSRPSMPMGRRSPDPGGQGREQGTATARTRAGQHVGAWICPASRAGERRGCYGACSSGPPSRCCPRQWLERGAYGPEQRVTVEPADVVVTMVK